ncbi:MAG: acyl carrier protein [Polyangiaceae bacterium]|nr:acyl carrier protein [Polyangiaceae bacterium]
MTWNRKNVESKVIEVFTKHRQSQVDVELSTRIVADLGIDSLGVMEVLAEVEDTYGLLIPDEALKQIETVGDVITAIVERLGQDGRLSE